MSNMSKGGCTPYSNLMKQLEDIDDPEMHTVFKDVAHRRPAPAPASAPSGGDFAGYNGTTPGGHSMTTTTTTGLHSQSIMDTKPLARKNPPNGGAAPAPVMQPYEASTSHPLQRHSDTSVLMQYQDNHGLETQNNFNSRYGAPPQAQIRRTSSSEASAQLSISLAQQYREMFNAAASQESDNRSSSFNGSQASWNDMRPSLSKTSSRDSNFSLGSVDERQKTQNNVSLPAPYTNAESSLVSEYKRAFKEAEQQKRGVQRAASSDVARPIRGAANFPTSPPLTIQTPSPYASENYQMPAQTRNGGEEAIRNERPGAKMPPISMPAPRSNNMNNPLMSEYRAMFKGSEAGPQGTQNTGSMPLASTPVRGQGASNMDRGAQGSRGRALPTGRQNAPPSPHAARGRVRDIRSELNEINRSGVGRSVSPGALSHMRRREDPTMTKAKRSASPGALFNARRHRDDPVTNSPKLPNTQFASHDQEHLPAHDTKQDSHGADSRNEVESPKKSSVKKSSSGGALSLLRGRGKKQTSKTSKEGKSNAKFDLADQGSSTAAIQGIIGPDFQDDDEPKEKAPAKKSSVKKSPSGGALSLLRGRGKKSNSKSGKANAKFGSTEESSTSHDAAMQQVFGVDPQNESSPTKKSSIKKSSSGGALAKLRGGRKKSKSNASKDCKPNAKYPADGPPPLSPQRAKMDSIGQDLQGDLNPKDSRSVGRSNSGGLLSLMKRRKDRSVSDVNSVKTESAVPNQPPYMNHDDDKSESFSVRRTSSGGVLARMRRGGSRSSLSESGTAKPNSQFVPPGQPDIYPPADYGRPTSRGRYYQNGTNQRQKPQPIPHAPFSNESREMNGSRNNGAVPRRSNVDMDLSVPQRYTSGSGSTNATRQINRTGPGSNQQSSNTYTGPTQLNYVPASGSGLASNRQASYDAPAPPEPVLRRAITEPAPAPYSGGYSSSVDQGYHLAPPPSEYQYNTPTSTIRKAPPNSSASPDPGPTMIEISPGVKLPLVDFATTKRAYEKKMIGQQTCMDCQRVVNCVDLADYVICPHCQVVSPTQSTGRRRVNLSSGSKVALGFEGQLDM